MFEIDLNYFIIVELNLCCVIVIFNGFIIVSMYLVCMLCEVLYLFVQYILCDDVQMNLFECMQYYIYCLYKGDVLYYMIVVGDVCVENVVWMYE